MKPSVKIDASAFSKTLKQYAKTSKRDIDKIVNQKAYSVLIKAAAQNRTADRNKIIAELGQQATAIRAQKVRITRKGVQRGKLVTERVYAPALYAIVREKARKQGRVIPASQLEQEARKELGRRLSAVSFMKSGWFAALEPVARAIGKAVRNRRKKSYGGATPAKFGLTKTVAKFFNTSFNKPTNTSDPQPTRWAEEAIRKGLDQETANMRQRIAEKLQARARRMALSSGAG